MNGRVLLRNLVVQHRILADKDIGANTILPVLSRQDFLYIPFTIVPDVNPASFFLCAGGPKRQYIEKETWPLEKRCVWC